MPKKNPDHEWLEKSYKNLDFLSSPAARPLRILSEVLEPADRLRKEKVHNTVVFFGSARTPSPEDAKKRLINAQKKIKTHKKAPKKLQIELDEAQRNVRGAKYYKDASDLAEKLTHWFKNQPKAKHHPFVIASGGGKGIMEAANRGAHKANGKSIGLNISLPYEKDPNAFQTEDISFEFHYFFIRKFWFFYLAKALVIFPGGFGTFDEFFELLTLMQTQKTKKYMPVVLYGSEYWSKLINFDVLVDWQMIDKKDLKLFKIVDNVDEAYTYLKDELTKHYTSLN